MSLSSKRSRSHSVGSAATKRPINVREPGEARLDKNRRTVKRVSSELKSPERRSTAWALALALPKTTTWSNWVGEIISQLLETIRTIHWSNTRSIVDTSNPFSLGISELSRSTQELTVSENKSVDLTFPSTNNSSAIRFMCTQALQPIPTQLEDEDRARLTFNAGAMLMTIVYAYDGRQSKMQLNDTIVKETIRVLMEVVIPNLYQNSYLNFCNTLIDDDENIDGFDVVLESVVDSVPEPLTLYKELQKQLTEERQQ